MLLPKSVSRTIIGLMSSTSETEKMFYNAVWSAIGCNHRELKKLDSESSSWEEVFKKFLKKTGEKPDPEAEWKKLEKHGLRFIFKDDQEFPELLREIYWPPCGIYIKGDTTSLKKTALAVVGTRKATEDGLELAGKFGREFGEAGITVVSGLAFGIDAAAHKGCLNAGGATAAVLACGLDNVYPRTNERLAGEILGAGGVLISEYPPGEPPYPNRFIERNRIVSGLCAGVVIIEAPESSGALATARFASEQNREVFVTPGQASHRNFSGSHRLIRSGARLVICPADVLEDLNIVEPSAAVSGETSEEKIILDLLSYSSRPLEVDKIAEMANLESRAVNEALTLLLLKNIVKEDGEGYIVNKS